MPSKPIVVQFGEFLDENVPDAHYGVGGNIFLNKLPDNHEEDIACVVQYAAFSGFPSPHDEYRFQVLVRGHDFDNSLSGLSFAETIWENIHGWTRGRSPHYDGMLELIEAAGPPQAHGYDEQDRPEWVANYFVQVRQDIKHRSYSR